MRTLTIAAATWREAIRQPVSIIVLCIAAAVTYLSQFINFFHFDDAAGFNIIRQMSVAQTLMVGIVIAVFSASKVLAEEIENRTVVTLLAKPVHRYQVVLGKYLGIMLALASVFGIMVMISLAATWWAEAGFPKSRTNPALAVTELPALTTGQGTLAAAASYKELVGRPNARALDHLSSMGDVLLLASGQAVQLVAQAPLSASGEDAPPVSPGLAAVVSDGFKFLTERTALLLQAFTLAFVQVMVMAAVAVAVATRLPLVFNALICASVFVLGNLSWMLGRTLLQEASGEGVWAGLLWLLKGPAAAACFLLPNLENLDLSEALQAGMGPASAGVVIYGILYGIVYTALVLFAGILLFARREVA